MKLMIAIIILLVITFVSTFVGARMYFIDPKNTLNRISCLSFIITGCYALAEFSLCIITDQASANTTAWIHQILVIPLLFCYFISTKIYSEQNKTFPSWYKNFCVGPLFLAFILLSFCQTTYSTSFAPAPFLQDGEWRYIFNEENLSFKLFTFICIYGTALSIFHFYHGYKNAINRKEKKLRLGLLCVFIVAPLWIIFSFLIGISTIETGKFLVSPFAFICIFSLSLFYSNYQLLQLNPYKAFENILNHTSNQVAIFGLDMKIKYTNYSAKQLLKIDTLNLKNIKFNKIDYLRKKINYDEGKWEVLYNKLNQLKINQQLEHKINWTTDKGDKKLLVNFSPIFYKGKKLGYAAIASDITKLKKYEKQLEDFTEELQEKNQELERFAYIASHDLKTPLRNIISFLGLIRKKLEIRGDKDLLNYVNFANVSAKHMHQLVEDVLEFSKLTTKSSANVKAINCQSIIKQAINNLDLTIKERNAVVSFPNYRLDIFADKAQLVQLFQNLIQNGIKYNTQNTPKVQISHHSSQDYEHFSVRDNGIGIHEKYFEDIFEMFKRLHTNDEYDGTGIGLAICKKIVDLHGGNISIKSETEFGSIFSFTIKRKKEMPPLLTERLSEPLEKDNYQTDQS